MFSIVAENLHWLGDTDAERADSPGDTCLHGDVTAIIGGETLFYECSASATALFLLRSLYEDHDFNEWDKILPCCGMIDFVNEETGYVVLINCCNGKDWTVFHKGDFIELTTESGVKEMLHINDYKRVVFDFVDKIEAFYKNCNEKNISEFGDAAQNAYRSFWNEWHMLRNK